MSSTKGFLRFGSAALLGASGILAPAAPARAAQPELVVRSVSLDRSTARVSGLATLPVQVTARASQAGDDGTPAD
ncbi:MAG: hypothetical protein Q4P32_12825, partial [Micrococcales bacterium]|nr:hypothetical protein [Micrococcales bacterium]